MKPDKIHDALNLINDEWIEAVEKLRSKEKRKKVWNINIRKLVAAAACLCVVLLGVYSAEKAGLIFFKGSPAESNDTTESAAAEGEDMMPEETAEDTESAEESEEVGVETEGAEASEKWIRTAFVEIKEWQPDGFAGIITDITEIDRYDIGTEVVVKIGENCYVEVETDAGVYDAYGMPDQQKLPAGTEVFVYYDLWKTSTEEMEGTENTKIVLYAEMITSEYRY